MTLLTCPEPDCRRAWFTGPTAPEFVVQHLRRSHAHSETSALELLDTASDGRDPQGSP